MGRNLTDCNISAVGVGLAVPANGVVAAVFGADIDDNGCPLLFGCVALENNPLTGGGGGGGGEQTFAIVEPACEEAPLVIGGGEGGGGGGSAVSCS